MLYDQRRWPHLGLFLDTYTTDSGVPSKAALWSPLCFTDVYIGMITRLALVAKYWSRSYL